MRSIEEMDRYITDQREKQQSANLPLAGVRILDVATVIAAPFAATLLGDYGAEVIKVENPGNSDAIRSWGVIEEKDIHPFWSVIGRNKFPITLNLKMAEGRKILMELVRQSDVLIENMRPGSMEKLGIGKDALLTENPGLIIGSVSGFGATGPYSQRPGFGTLAEGYSGFTYLNAQPDGPPTNAPMALADFIVGTHLAFGVMVALQKQERGKCGGQIIDISLYEPLFSMLGPDFLSYFLTGDVPQPKGNELSYVAPRNNYRTRDNKWVAMSCAAQKPFERLMECIGCPEMIIDHRFKTNEDRIKDSNRHVLNQVVSRWVEGLDLEELLVICEKKGITAGKISSMKDIAEDSHYKERGSLVDIEDPATGINLKIPDVPFQMMSTPGRVRFPGLPHGAANSVIFREFFDYSTDKIVEMKETGVI